MPGLWFVLLALSLLAGCGRAATPDEQRETEIRDFAQLPGLRNASLKPLHDELEQLEREHALPVDLTSNPLSDDDNLAALLVDRLESNQVGATLPRTRKLLPLDGFEFSPIALEQALGLRRTFDPLLAEVRAALEHRPCNFAIDFRMGFAADRTFVDRCELLISLESFHAAEALANDDPVDAMPHLRAMLLLTRHLAAEKSVEARIAAAQLRALSLSVLEAIVQHPSSDRAILAACAQLVNNQIATWPSDADAWIGDRAMVLHSYEVIREGRVMELLTPDEVRMLADEGILHELPAATQKVVNADELFYLQSMRRVIEACGRPFYQRLDLLAEIRQALHQRRNTATFPLAAARFFLPNLEQYQAVQAHDRARTEAWAIALALALGGQQPDYSVSPFSGEPYTVTIETTRVVVAVPASLPRSAIAPIIKPETALR